MPISLLFLLLFQAPPVSFIDQSILSSNEKIAKDPALPEGYNELALALTRKERETGDVALLAKAEAAVQKSLQLQPANFEARKARVAIRLRQSRFEDALEEARALNKQTPDDNLLYGYLSEAEIGLGDYPAAEKSVQRMLDLRNVNGPGQEYGAIVREWIGFPDAAIEWWNSSLHLTSERDSEKRAYIQSQIARVYREMGKYDAAAASAKGALSLCPGYPPALFELSRVLLEQGKAAESAAMLQALLKSAWSLTAEYWLTRALDSPADKAAAQAAGERFVKDARAAIHQPANANAFLVRYLADHGNATEAVTIGREAVARRPDVFALDAYAWALFRSGQPTAAWEPLQKALQPGLRDAALYYDAGVIAKATKHPSEATAYFKKAFEINTSSPQSGEILKQLSSLQGASPN